MFDLLDELRKHPAAAVGESAPVTDVLTWQKMLAEKGFPEMPEEFVDLLHHANGVMFNGIEFFGVGENTLEVPGYRQSDIYSANERDGVEECLLLGRSDEDIYVYNPVDGIFEALDRVDLANMEDFDSFDELFTSVMEDRFQ